MLEVGESLKGFVTGIVAEGSVGIEVLVETDSSSDGMREHQSVPLRETWLWGDFCPVQIHGFVACRLKSPR